VAKADPVSSPHLKIVGSLDAIIAAAALDDGVASVNTVAFDTPAQSARNRANIRAFRR
jgi:hypothetical protein